ncbi:MAG TPA: RbsD/FucU domain-containing protein [Terracidiphilus sp.]|nr:RbsD/FucU domain-containing protein [Terracidiphilus sp.]
MAQGSICGVWRDITRRHFLGSGFAFGIGLGAFPKLGLDNELRSPDGGLPVQKSISERNMLKLINPLLTGDLLAILSNMGHGDEVVIADANFPAESIARRLVRYPGISATDVLAAVLSVLPLDDFVDHPAAAMDAPGQRPAIYPEYEEALKKAEGRVITLEPVERFAFYDRAKAAFAVIATGELRLYANIILRKGVLRS